MMKGKNFGKLNVPDHWQQYWSRYPQGYTILEALINWVSQVNDMSDNINDWNNYLDEFVEKFDKELQATVETTLLEWFESGFLKDVVNEAFDYKFEVIMNDIDQRIRIVNENKRDKSVKITLSDIDQEFKDAIVGEGSVPVVGEGSVDTINIVDGAVNNDKLSTDFESHYPWLDSVDDDLDYQWQTGTTLVSADVANNPTGNIALLEVRLSSTTRGSNLRWLTQTITKIATGHNEVEQYKRVLSVDMDDLSIRFLSDWQQNVVGEVTRDKLSDDYTVNYPWLGGAENDVDSALITGTYMVDEDTQNNPSSQIGLLEVTTGKTTRNSNLAWVVQKMTVIASDTPHKIYTRTMRTTTENGETSIDFVNGWQLTNDKDTTNYPWLGGATNDLDNVFEPGTYMFDGSTKNNPTNDIGILEVKKAKTTRGSNLTWLIQEATLIRNGTQHTTYKRTMRTTTASGETTIDFIDEWQALGTGSDTNEYHNIKWVALGTSITSRGEYVDKVTSTLGLNTDNRGVGSGGITSHAGAGNTTMQAVETIEDFKGIVSVELGANDWGNCPLGELGDTEDSTWYGALDKVCRTITKRTSARPFFITSPRRVFQLGADFDEERRRSVYEVNSFGFSYVDYCNAVKEVTQHYGIPVVDIPGDSGLGGYNNNSETLIDHIHLSDIGGEIMANQIIKFLKHTFSPFPDRYNNPLT